MTSDWHVTRQAQARLPNAFGAFQLALYTTNQDDKEHLALFMGETRGANVLTRIHSECFTGDVLGSRRCDCGEQLESALRLIAAEGRGVLVYLRQEGRGIGLRDKLRAYNLQDQGYDTIDANLALGHQADARDYTVAVRILHDLGVTSVRLMTNNPAKLHSLTALSMPVTERVLLHTTVYPDNEAYLRTKAERLSHWLHLNGQHE